MSNRYLAKIAKTTLEAFENSFPPNVIAEVVGNPIRDEILAISGRTIHVDDLHILVLGGSQGARNLNSVCLSVFSGKGNVEGFSVWHQAGKKDFVRVKSAYEEGGCSNVKCSEFIDDMANAYAWADVVVSRAGALSVAEIGAAELPALFVPFPHAVDDHQTKNAQHLSSVGAAVLMPQDELTPDSLAQVIRSLLNDQTALRKMRIAAHHCFIPSAAAVVADALIEVSS